MKKNILPNIIIIISTIILIIGLLICNISIAFSIENIAFMEESENNVKIVSESGSGSVENEGLASTIYTISNLYDYISTIPPKTLVSEFKKGFNIEESKIHIYKTATLKEEVNDGYVKTNMGIRFDGIEKNYLALVVGDINGDGLANQIELQMLIKHIIGMQGNKLTGISFICADLNSDGKVNQIDLKILIDYIIYGRIIVEKPEIPRSPKIEIVSGVLGNDNYYKTKPVIKITETENRNVGKTTYRLEGAETKAETDIVNNGRITLEKNGTYTITCYTYSKEGLKSRSYYKSNKSRY